MNFDTEQFKVLDTNPGGTLELFNRYVDRIKLVFDLAFRDNDGTPREPTDKEKKASHSLRVCLLVLGRVRANVCGGGNLPGLQMTK